MMKDSGLLMILEMKPSMPPYNLTHSKRTGTEVAKIVQEMGIEKQVVLSSFDPFKIYHARKQLPSLNTCFLHRKDYWDDVMFASLMKADLEELKGFKDCAKNVPPLELGKFTLENPTLAKAIGASSLDMSYDMYNNHRYSNKTYYMFKNNYGTQFSYGAWTIYKMSLSEVQLEESEEHVKSLIKNNAGRLYTDDIPRLLNKLGRPVHRNSAQPTKLFQTQHYVVLALCLYLFL